MSPFAGSSERHAQKKGPDVNNSHGQTENLARTPNSQTNMKKHNKRDHNSSTIAATTNGMAPADTSSATDSTKDFWFRRVFNGILSFCSLIIFFIMTVAKIAISMLNIEDNAKIQELENRAPKLAQENATQATDIKELRRQLKEAADVTKDRDEKIKGLQDNLNEALALNYVDEVISFFKEREIESIKEDHATEVRKLQDELEEASAGEYIGEIILFRRDAEIKSLKEDLAAQFQLSGQLQFNREHGAASRT